MPKIWTYIENPLFTTQLAEFGDSDAIHELIAGVLWAISTNPGQFPRIPNTRLQFVRTIQFERDVLLVPMKIWFTCIDENQIEILSIAQDTLDDNDDDWF